MASPKGREYKTIGILFLSPSELRIYLKGQFPNDYTEGLCTLLGWTVCVHVCACAEVGVKHLP